MASVLTFICTFAADFIDTDSLVELHTPRLFMVQNKVSKRVTATILSMAAHSGDSHHGPVALCSGRSGMFLRRRHLRAAGDASLAGYQRRTHHATLHRTAGLLLSTRGAGVADGTISSDESNGRKELCYHRHAPALGSPLSGSVRLAPRGHSLVAQPVWSRPHRALQGGHPALHRLPRSGFRYAPFPKPATSGEEVIGL